MFGPHSKPISAIPAWFKTDFGPFWPFRLPADTTQFGRYNPILVESAQFSANQAELAQICEKKKKKLKCGTDMRVAASILHSGTVYHSAHIYVYICPHIYHSGTVYHSAHIYIYIYIILLVPQSYCPLNRQHLFVYLFY